jgi:hypothetical protein
MAAINPIPGPEVIEAWRQDYSIMQEQMIYGDSPGFDEMIETIRRFTGRINALDWKITL